MRPLHIAFIYFSNILSLAIAVYTMQRNGVRVQVMLYAFLIDYVMRLYTLTLLHGAVKRRRGLLASIAPYVSRLPAPGQESMPMRQENSMKPAGLGMYLVAVGVLAFFAFVLANVNDNRELDLSASQGFADFQWAVIFAVLYLVNSLLTRAMVIHPRESVAMNLGYNSKELSILAVAVLVGGLVVVVRQASGLGASAWTVMGPLLAFRTWYDIWFSLDTLPAIEADPSP